MLSLGRSWCCCRNIFLGAWIGGSPLLAGSSTLWRRLYWRRRSLLAFFLFRSRCFCLCLLRSLYGRLGLCRASFSARFHWSGGARCSCRISTGRFDGFSSLLRLL